MINRVGDELDGLIDRLLPEAGTVDAGDARLETGIPDGAGGKPLSLPKSGYVQTIEYETLVKLAHDHDVILTLRFRAGSHLLAGGHHVLVFPLERANEELAGKIADAVVLGNRQHTDPGP